MTSASGAWALIWAMPPGRMSVPWILPRLPERSPVMVPILSSGTMTSMLTMGSRRTGWALRMASRKANLPAVRKATSLVSTGWPCRRSWRRGYPAWIAGDRALFEEIADAFFDGGFELAGDRAAEGFVDELEPFAAFEGFDAKEDLAELARRRRIVFCDGDVHRPGGDGFAVGDFGRLGVDANPRLSFSSIGAGAIRPGR